MEQWETTFPGIWPRFNCPSATTPSAYERVSCDQAIGISNTHTWGTNTQVYTYIHTCTICRNFMFQRVVPVL